MLLGELRSLGWEKNLNLDPSHRSGKCRELLEISKEYCIVKEVDRLAAGPLYIRKSDAELTLTKK
jgi:hypothetical protein